MNLTTLAERACLETGYNDTDDLAAAKKFARHWDEHIWNAALWKDSLIACDITVSPSTNDDHAEGVVYLPEVIDRVVAVRTAVNLVRIQGQEYFYQMDFDSFVEEGDPWNYNILPPAWFKWRSPDSGSYLQVSGSQGDSAVALRLIWQDASGRRTVTKTTVGAAAILTPADDTAITLLAAFKGTSTADVSLVNPYGLNLVAGRRYDTSSLGNYYMTVPLVIGRTYNYIQGNSTLLGAAVLGPYQPVGTFVAIATNYVLKCTAGNLGAVTTASIREVSSTTVATLAAADTENTAYTRIWLQPVPVNDVSLKVLGKSKYVELDFDQQEPALRNCTLALLAFIRGSLRRRGGEIQVSQLEFAEGNALLDRLKIVEAVQAANNQRFQPDYGLGPEYGIGPG